MNDFCTLNSERIVHIDNCFLSVSQFGSLIVSIATIDLLGFSSSRFLLRLYDFKSTVYSFMYAILIELLEYRHFSLLVGRVFVSSREQFAGYLTHDLPHSQTDSCLL